MNYADEDIRAYVKSDKSLDGVNNFRWYSKEETSLKKGNYFTLDNIGMEGMVMALFSNYNNNNLYAYRPEISYGANRFCFFYKIKEGLYLNFKNENDTHFVLEIWDERNGKPEIIKLDSLSLGNQYNNLCFFHTIEFFMAALDIIKKEGDINKEKIEQYIVEPFKKNKDTLIKQYENNESRIRLYTLALVKVSKELDRYIYDEINNTNLKKDVRDRSYLESFFSPSTYEKFEKIKKLNDLRVYLINRIRENSPLLGVVEKQLNVEKLEQKMTEDGIIETIKLDDLIQLYKYIRDESYGSCTRFLNTYRAFFKDEQSLPEKQQDFLNYIKKNKNTIEQKIYQKIKELSGYPIITSQDEQSTKKLVSMKPTYLAGRTEKQNPPAKKERPHVTFSLPPEDSWIQQRKTNGQEHRKNAFPSEQQQKVHKGKLNDTPPTELKQEKNNNFKSVEYYKKLLEQHKEKMRQRNAERQKNAKYNPNYKPSNTKSQVPEQQSNKGKTQLIRKIITEATKEIRKNPNNKNISDTIKHLKNVVIVNVLYIGLSKEKSENIIKKYFNEKYPEQLKPMLLALGYALAENKQTYIEDVINISRTVKPTAQTICTLEGFINLYKTIDPNNQDNIKRLYDSLSFIKRLRTIEDRRRIHTELDDAESHIFRKNNISRSYKSIN